MSNITPTIPFIVGPTAVGKTATAVELAKGIGGEIISVDSRQIYRELDVGTDKPTPEQQQRVPHHLINLVSPREQISAGRYRTLALGKVAEILARGNLPIFVGGSGMYIKAVVQGIFRQSETDLNIRKKIQQELCEKGKIALYNRLVEVDPDRAIKIHINDVKRITRALEIYEMTGKPSAQIYEDQSKSVPFPYYIFVLDRSRESLYQRINQRVEQMIRAGLISETEQLIQKGYRDQLKKLKTLGYEEVLLYLDGKCSQEEMIEKIKQNTRRFAKRQLTWFRNQLDTVWITIDHRQEPADIARIIKQHIRSK